MKKRVRRPKASRPEVTGVDFTGRESSTLTFLSKALITTAQALRLKKAKISLSLVGDAAMKRLNWSYRRKRKTTDVLSFSQEHFAADPYELGDIIISVAQATRQAKAAGKTKKEELLMLAVHGLLHLQGYDHETSKDAKKMFGLQSRLLKELRIK